jgi:hypothetical protein
MSDDIKKPEDAKANEDKMTAFRDWDKGNTNVTKAPFVDQPTQVIDHPEFEPDTSLVGKENPVGVPTDEQKKQLNWLTEGQEAGSEMDTAKFGRSAGQMLTSGTANSGGNSGQGPSLRVHGFSFPGYHIGAGLNYYTIYTTIDITPTGIGALFIPRGTPPGVYTDTVSNSQLMLDKLVETISLRAQPVVMSQITSMSAADYNATNTPTFDPASGTVWSMSFTIEHNGAWDTKQVGWTNSLNPVGVARPAIMGGPTPYTTNPDLGDTINSNLAFMAPPFVNTGNPADAATNTIVVVSSGPF